MRFVRSFVSGLFVVVMVACGSTSDAPEVGSGNGAPEAGTPRTDAGAGSAVDDAGATDSGAIVIDKDAGLATVSGFVSRTAPIASGLDGKGSLFIALMDKNPVTDAKNAKSLANILIKNADLSAAGAMVPFKLENVPVVHGYLFVSVFFDDNGNADTSGDGSKAGPDKGDLVNLDLVSPLKVKIDLAAEHKVDVVLNAGLPF